MIEFGESFVPQCLFMRLVATSWEPIDVITEPPDQVSMILKCHHRLGKTNCKVCFVTHSLITKVFK